MTPIESFQDAVLNRREADFVVMNYSPTSPDHGAWFDQGAMVYLDEYKYSFVCESGEGHQGDQHCTVHITEFPIKTSFNKLVSVCEEGENACIPNDPAKAE